MVWHLSVQIASPACTELEVVMLDWLGKMLDLPADFLACSGGKGGGVIQGTASEATLVALLGAKAKALRGAKEANPDTPEALLSSKLVGYCSGERNRVTPSIEPTDHDSVVLTLLLPSS
jgi:aromatic-L-amino-acid/L-tryptophan decarboxylase